jgi:type II secretion system protein H
VIVLVLMVIAAGVIVPRVGRDTGERELRDAAGRFAHVVRTVRELAVSSRTECAIEIDLTRNGYRAVMQSATGDDDRAQTVRVSWLKPERWPESIRITDFRTPDGTAARGETQRLRFYPDGTSSGASFRMVTDDAECSVIVHPHSGHVVFGDQARGNLLPDQYDLGD